MSAQNTPVMRQHAAAKAAHPDAIVLFRLGDFYEMFGTDAVLGAQLLSLTLTSRNKGKPDEIPMAGVPYHAASAYIGRLLAAGQRVALCEQMADPATTKGIVPREVVRVITPGTITEEDHLDARVNNWLAAVHYSASEVGVALCDLSTGELKAAAVPSLVSALTELTRSRPREVLLAGDGVDELPADTWVAWQQALGLGQLTPDETMSRLAAEELVAPCRLASTALSEVATMAAARALRFIKRCNPSAARVPQRLVEWTPSDTLLISETVQSHLELLSSPGGGTEASVLRTIDRTQTAGGARLMRQRLLAPLVEVQAIRGRLDQVEALVVHSALRANLRRHLGEVTDLERLTVRACCGEATPRDLGRLRTGLAAAEKAILVLTELARAQTMPLAPATTDPALAELSGLLGRALLERPPPTLKDEPVFQPEYDPELTALQELYRHGESLTQALETRLRDSLQIPTLKVRYTRVFGWYVEVSRAHAARVPPTFHRKQTVAGGERYNLDELDELAERLERAETDFRARQRELFQDLVEKVVVASRALFRLSHLLSEWDCAAALADLAHEQDYVRPTIDDSLQLSIVEGRHPVVERFSARGRFVPNDVHLDARKERLWLITGPNMAGKSTLLRQTAIITLLGQMGSFVPARSAHIGVVDRLLSRVGAGDNLAAGESTFMVEMRETAEILRTATERSLIIVDEIGRGTSTFDGLSIAWAVAEYLEKQVGCRTLFATHYHELTELAMESTHSANHSVAAQERDGSIVFLHRLVPGAASRSYGVAVARLAGLPIAVLSRAQQILQRLEGTQRPVGTSADRPAKEAQLPLFDTTSADPTESAVLDALNDVDPNQMTPLAALQLVTELHTSLRGARTPRKRRRG